MRFGEGNGDDAKVSSQETAQRPTYRNSLEIKDWEVPTTSIPESTDDAVGHDPNASAVIKAINTGIPGEVKETLAKMDEATAFQALRNEGCLGRIAIMHAALRGDLELFNVVLCEMRSRLKKGELREALTALTGHHGKESLLIFAAKGGNSEIFNIVVKLLDGAILEVTVQQFHYGNDVLKASARHGSLDTFNTVSEILQTKLDLDQALEMVLTNNSIEHSILTTSFMSGNGYALGAWAVALSRTLPQDEMVKACVASFAYCAQHRSGHLRGLAVLIANGANASPEDLIRFAKTFTLDSLKECFIDAFSWVDNPFIPGMAISVALNDTVPKAPEREGRVLFQLMDTVTVVLSEVLKRLPQTLREFEGGTDGCRLMLEPEAVEPYPAGFAGPLRLALDMQQFTETFCVAPLVFEYLSRQFVAGLPDMRDTENILCPPDRDDASSTDEWMGPRNLLNDGLVAHTGLGKEMQGIWSTASRAARSPASPKRLYKIWGTTILPGAQFVAVSVLTRPETLYHVPAMRLALDFVVHVVMLLLYTGAILTAEDGDLTVTECLLIIHVMAAIFGEFIELYHGAQEYFRDKWNWLDMISLFFLASALYIRGWGSDDTIVTVKVLFALSAPLLFARFLFFAQILRRQGVVIEMITNMLGQFLHFGMVMVVIMVGFAVAFIALIVDDTTTFGTVFVGVFNAMLGDTGIFDDYTFISSFWVSVLNMVYLVLMTIVMLNLLIAVLSTEHAKVDERSDYSFGVSKIRMIKLYQKVVDTDLLSPPFNLVQLAISLPFCLADAIFGLRLLCVVQRAIGITIFWCVTGPIAIILGALLWLVSIPKAVVATWEGTHFGGYSLLSRFLSCFVVFIFYLGGAGFVLLSFWLYSGFLGVMFLLRISSPASWSNYRASVATSVLPRPAKSEQGIETISVQNMLTRAPGGLCMREIWEFLEDPHSATSPAMRREEQGRPATVEHIRRLENNFNALREAMVGLSSRVDNIVISREAKTSVNHEGLNDDQPSDRLGSRILERISLLEEKIDKILINGSQ